MLEACWLRPASMVETFGREPVARSGDRATTAPSHRSWYQIAIWAKKRVRIPGRDCRFLGKSEWRKSVVGSTANMNGGNSTSTAEAPKANRLTIGLLLSWMATTGVVL